MHCSEQVEQLKKEFTEMKIEIRATLKEIKETYAYLERSL